jgi:nitroreductase
LDILETARTRRSIRKYRRRPVSQRKLKKVLESAHLAPSAGNLQSWSFVVVRDKEKKRMLAKAADNQAFMDIAAVIIAALGDRRVSKKWLEKDVMIAVEHMILSATSLGYGACWIGAFSEAAVKSLLNIPQRLSAVPLLPIRVPDEAPPARSQREFADVFFEDVYGQPLALR